MTSESWGKQIRREIRQQIDPLCGDIVERRIDSWEARKRWEVVRAEIALKVPNQLDLIDRIYGSRVNRLIEQFAIPAEVDELTREWS